MIGLFEFVNRAYECYVDSWAEPPVAYLGWEAASQGDYRMASKIAKTIEDYSRRCLALPSEEDDPYEFRSDQLVVLRQGLDVHGEHYDVVSLFECFDHANWSSFTWACELAERIDCLLLTLEQSRWGANLARGCRQDLDGLLVLADWCEDTDLPRAASEARHLHGLVRQEIGFGEPIPRHVEVSERFEPAVE